MRGIVQNDIGSAVEIHKCVSFQSQEVVGSYESGIMAVNSQILKPFGGFIVFPGRWYLIDWL
jgi:hypothetical protein